MHNSSITCSRARSRSTRAALIAAAGCACLLAQAPARAQSFQGLGIPPGATASFPSAISRDGRVVIGNLQTPAGDRPFRWMQGAGVEELPMLPGWTSARARGVSGDGSIIVGDTGEQFTPRAVRWIVGAGGITAEELSLPGTISSTALGISNDGSVIVGGTNPGGAFRWTEAGGMMSLSPEFYATAVSDNGATVVGTGSFCAAYWTSATGAVALQPCGPNNYHSATGVSADGSIVAGFADGFASPNLAARWVIHPTVSQATYLYSPTPPGNSAAFAISRSGQIIVGTGYSTSGGGAVFWHDSLGATSIPAYLAAAGVNLAGWELDVATGISDFGQIVGWGTHNSATEGWLATIPHRSFYCYANCDNSSVEPILNVDDFICFINEFAHAVTLPHQQQLIHYANCDGANPPPVLNVDDFTCFINEFAAGCP